MSKRSTINAPKLALCSTFSNTRVKFPIFCREVSKHLCRKSQIISVCLMLLMQST